MGTMKRRAAIALATVGLVVAMGCAKDETVSSADTTTPVTAPSGAGGSSTDGTTKTPGTDRDEDEDQDTTTSTSTSTSKDKDKDEDKTSTTTASSRTGTGDYEEACAAIEDLEALDDDDNEDFDKVFALMETARDASPDELVEHWDALIDVFGELADLDENSPEAMAKALGLFEDPEFLEAAAAIDDFAEEECGIDIDLDPAEEGIGGLNDDGLTSPTTSRR